MFNVPRAETPALVGGDSATRNISGVLKVEVPAWPMGPQSEFGLHIYNQPPSSQKGNSILRVHFVLDFLSPPLLLSFSE